MTAKKAIRESGDILNYLFILGFLGILWLVIYGNVSGNLGFKQVGTNYYNQTITLTGTGATPAGASGKQNPSLSSVIVTNATSGAIVETANYTYSGATFYNATAAYGGQPVNVSYNIYYDSDGKVNTDGVIRNVTGGAKTFFSFSNTLFTVTAIALLVAILLGLLALVMSIVKKTNNKSGFSQE